MLVLYRLNKYNIQYNAYGCIFASFINDNSVFRFDVPSQNKKVYSTHQMRVTLYDEIIIYRYKIINNSCSYINIYFTRSDHVVEKIVCRFNKCLLVYRSLSNFLDNIYETHYLIEHKIGYFNGYDYYECYDYYEKNQLIRQKISLEKSIKKIYIDLYYKNNKLYMIHKNFYNLINNSKSYKKKYIEKNFLSV